MEVLARGPVEERTVARQRSFVDIGDDRRGPLPTAGARTGLDARGRGTQVPIDACAVDPHVVDVPVAAVRRRDVDRDGRCALVFETAAQRCLRGKVVLWLREPVYALVVDEDLNRPVLAAHEDVRGCTAARGLSTAAGGRLAAGRLSPAGGPSTAGRQSPEIDGMPAARRQGGDGNDEGRSRPDSLLHGNLHSSRPSSGPGIGLRGRGSSMDWPQGQRLRHQKRAATSVSNNAPEPIHGTRRGSTDGGRVQGALPLAGARVEEAASAKLPLRAVVVVEAHGG